MQRYCLLRDTNDKWYLIPSEESDEFMQLCFVMMHDVEVGRSYNLASDQLLKKFGKRAIEGYSSVTFTDPQIN